jgi:hypothetical protein
MVGDCFSTLEMAHFATFQEYCTFALLVEKLMFGVEILE